jgi:hypothetical protein
MAIRLNLLAEAQAADQQRRRDPVKRALVAAVLLIALMLVWSSSLQLKLMLARSDLSRAEAQMGARANQYKHVLDNQKQLNETRDRLDALQHLATNRFLSANLLNALQHATLEDVQLRHLGIDQSYTAAQLIKPRAPGDHSPSVPQPAVAERIVMALDACDTSPNPGDQINRFKEVVAANPFFHELLELTNAVSLKNLSSPQLSPATGKSCVLFTLECRGRERIR